MEAPNFESIFECISDGVNKVLVPITDSVYTLKRCGEKNQPCLTPLSIVNELLWRPFHLMSVNWSL